MLRRTGFVARDATNATRLGEAWRNQRIEGERPYLYLDGIVMKRTWAGEVRNVSLLVASAVNSEGFREILGICEGAKEDKSGWSAFLRHLVDRDRQQQRRQHEDEVLQRAQRVSQEIVDHAATRAAGGGASAATPASRDHSSMASS